MENCVFILCINVRKRVSLLQNSSSGKISSIFRYNRRDVDKLIRTQNSQILSVCLSEIKSTLEPEFLWEEFNHGGEVCGKAGRNVMREEQPSAIHETTFIIFSQQWPIITINPPLPTQPALLSSNRIRCLFLFVLHYTLLFSRRKEKFFFFIHISLFPKIINK